ncbi:MAG: peptidase and chymotrypsin/Hap [Verrucomicrobiales bacterium]|nr:peptidase and chymotrypsin/Hap [Verrucomicrobiales bacterium]
MDNSGYVSIQNMERKWEFRYSAPSPGPKQELVSAEETERLLLKRLKDETAAPHDALWELAKFYSHTKQHEKALDCLRRIMASLPDAERKAACVLAMGQTMEQVADYPAAIRYYREAFALEPTNTRTWYLIHNNLGFSLNTLGQFSEGERLCRIAVQIDPDRPNAYKNLGISLEGQGRYEAAAEYFVQGTKADASDARSYHLLLKLLNEHPELSHRFSAEAECCRKAVEFAAAERQKSKP